ncbi:MAG: Rrf2 family transcriptional regulator [Phycisphaerae bacterium]|jgi:Rrf2 family protein
MRVSQKCQYAVRAILELAKRFGQGPTSISEIASSQAVPQRFLEIILNEMKQGGFVGSRRGVQGGYLLLVEPRQLTVGRIMRVIDGPFDPVRCVGEGGKPCPLKGHCSMIELWQRAKQAVEEVYDNTTFQDLVDREAELGSVTAANYTI